MRRFQTGAATRTLLVSMTAIVVFLGIAVMMLPKGFSGDTSIIGKGTAVVVLAHNKDSVQSLNMMDYMNQIRGDYSGRIDFLVADANTPQGSAFIQLQQVELGALLLFAPDGRRLQVLGNLNSASGLRTALDTEFK